MSRIKLQLCAWTLLTPNAWSPELVAEAVAVVVLVSDDVAVEELVAVAVDDSVYTHNHTSQAAITGLLSTSVLTTCESEPMTVSANLSWWRWPSWS